MRTNRRYCEMGGGEEVKTIVKILLWIWQAPQHIIGLILLAVYRPFWMAENGRYRFYEADAMRGGISLGEIIIVQNRASKTMCDHEYGHTIQSRRLGPLYLLVIGLPSITWAGIYLLICRLARPGTRLPDYHKAPWEAWADRLGGVVR